MRCLILQHLDHDGPGLLSSPLFEGGWEVELRRLEPGRVPEWISIGPEQSDAWEPFPIGGDPLEGLDDDRFDLLLILGGQFAAYDLDRVGFLREELRRLERRLQAGRPTLGICLGAQLMAAALGAPVVRGPAPEIGWLPLALTPQGEADPVFAPLGPTGSHTLQWHGDTFACPPGATLLASSRLTRNQAFRLGPHSYALQFHPEIPIGELPVWVERSDPPLTGPPRTPTGEEILRGGREHGRAYEERAHRFMIGYLSSLESAG